MNFEGRKYGPDKRLEKEDIIYPEISRLYRRIERLLTQLKPEIDKCAYELIIGDDTSGRIPTLIFERVMNTLYREKKSASAQCPIF